MVVDLEGFTYMRQDQKGMLLGIYEVNHRALDDGRRALGLRDGAVPGTDRPDRARADAGLRALPALQNVGVKTWVNGAFTFSPDGNPLVGPVRGQAGYWCACAVMAGFLQGGGVGKTLAEWMIHGEPEADVWHGRGPLRPWAENKRVHPPDHRPVLFPPLRDDLSERAAAGGTAAEDGAGLFRDDGRRLPWGAVWGLEVPLYFAPQGFEENPSLKRSNAHDVVGAECRRCARRGPSRYLGLLPLRGVGAERGSVARPADGLHDAARNRAARGWRRCWAMTGGSRAT
jgi:dimethylglycine dehydrogenase